MYTRVLATLAGNQPQTSAMPVNATRHVLHWVKIKREYCAVLKPRGRCVCCALAISFLATCVLLAALSGRRKCDLLIAARPWTTYKVPNLVHFIRFGNPKVTFVEMICLRAAYENIRPDRLYVHCDQAPTGPWWEMVKGLPNVRVLHRERPRTIFGRHIELVYHASDVARLQILQEYGGIYLDNDVYVTACLDEFRNYDFTLGWPRDRFIGNQVLIATRRSRFLALYYDSYRHFNGSIWYYNAGQLPTTTILREQPELVHRVEKTFAVDTNYMYEVFHKKFPWRDYHAFHLLYRFYNPFIDAVKQHNPRTIRKLDTAFGQMARLVYYGTDKLLPA